MERDAKRRYRPAPSRLTKAVNQEVTYRSALAMVYDKRGILDAVSIHRNRLTESRWAIDNDERPRTRFCRAFWISRSVEVSRALIATSQSAIEAPLSDMNRPSSLIQ